jgi:NAD(P)H-dependent flavin oxidoreductase YrpB (nitropropane dioxygenase family)
MVLVTNITKLFGIQHPILQGGMHYVGYAGLSAAVANAGGLGFITALTQPTPELLAEEIEKAKGMLDKDCKGKLGVNLTILPMFSQVDYPAYRDVILNSGIDVVETAGAPPTEFVKAFQSRGIKVIHKCVTTRHALSAIRKSGVDAISLDGFECGGHPGESDIGNFILQTLGGIELGVSEE